MRVEHADAAAARDVLQDAVQQEGALAAAGRADDVHMLKARLVVDFERAAGVVDAECDEVVWADTPGFGGFAPASRGCALRNVARRSSRDL